jgi:hypothetical protein
MFSPEFPVFLANRNQELYSHAAYLNLQRTFMKIKFALLLLVLSSSLAFAGNPSFSTGQNFLTTAPNADAECTGIASVLSQISNPNLSISIDDNCSLNKHHNKFVRIFTRVISDIGSWGVAEIACKTEKYGPGCGDKFDYLSLQATATVPASDETSFQGTPVAMNDSDCLFYSNALSQLPWSSGNVKLSATCSDGMLYTTFDISQ